MQPSRDGRSTMHLQEQRIAQHSRKYTTLRMHRSTPTLAQRRSEAVPSLRRLQYSRALLPLNRQGNCSEYSLPLYFLLAEALLTKRGKNRHDFDEQSEGSSVTAGGGRYAYSILVQKQQIN